jgi:sugar phosphate isomerase/epimerase
MNRRRFISSLAAAGATGYGLVACAPAGSAVPTPGRLDRIGVQLYTLRDRLQQDVSTNLAAIAEIGYQEVETAGLYGLTPARFREEMDRVGLVSPAGHYGLDGIRRDLEGTVSTALALGQTWILVPSLGAADRTPEGYRHVAEDLNRFGAAARDRGIRFGYHNHDFEFATLENGEVGYDLLLTGTDPELIDMELDLYWAVRGGRDPVELMGQYPGRFRLCHAKDMAAVGGDRRMVDVGQGEIDFARIFAHGEVGGLRHYFVEHDRPEDSLASVRASYAHLRELTF